LDFGTRRSVESVGSLRYRYDLVTHLVWRDFTLRFKGSLLGALWSLLPPLAQLLVLVFLFRRVVPLGIEAYPAFVLSGLLPWTWFSSCLNSAGGLFIANRDVVRRPHFDPVILVAVNILSNLLHYLVFLPVLFGMLAFYERKVGLPLLVFPLLLAIQAVLTMGLGLAIATLNVFYRDVQYVTSVVLMLLFYLTPVFYQTIDPRYQLLFTVNPIAALVQGYRAVLFYGRSPDWGALMLASAMSVAFIAFGYRLYRRRLSSMMDVL
jgi:lipopolysaccharide transport system permease protein